MDVNCVFNMPNPLFEPLLEEHCVLVAELFLIIADGVDHCSKQFVFLVSTNVECAEIADVQFFDDVV